jgi:3-hydroxybutyryl-CoA dehydrogenase
MIITVCVCGAGTMGSGIAQVAAQAGFNTVLYDVSTMALERARISIESNLQYLLKKDKISVAEMPAILNRIQFTDQITDCTGEIIIEAIAEINSAKISLLNQLAAYNNEEVIFATNTSSLSVSAIQEKVDVPQRVVGMHFFNPPGIMKLVEVVKGALTEQNIANAVYEICQQMGKVPVFCQDSPGFIVNRIARHYYLEALQLAQEGVASFEDIDLVMEASGFKMGPFRLMDLIGMDINLAVSQGIYEAFAKPERFKPSALQAKKVADNELGKKTGVGFYKY